MPPYPGRMIKPLIRLAAAVILLAGAGSTAATDLVPSPLAGAVWRITAIDGRQPEPPHSDDSRRQVPQFAFGWRSYGGNAGCNALGGLYAQVGERFYTMPGPQTQMACGGPRGAQEDAANAIFESSPIVTRSGDTAVLVGGGHRMELERRGAHDGFETPAMLEAAPIDGSSYVIHAVNGRPTDGKRIWSKTPPRLSFAGGRVTVALDCPKPATGAYNPGTEHVFVTHLPVPCTLPGTRDAALAQILRLNPRAVPGPNGELLLASTAGWAILWNERRDRPK